MVFNFLHQKYLLRSMYWYLNADKSWYKNKKNKILDLFFEIMPIFLEAVKRTVRRCTENEMRIHALTPNQRARIIFSQRNIIRFRKRFKIIGTVSSVKWIPGISHFVATYTTCFNVEVMLKEEQHFETYNYRDVLLCSHLRRVVNRFMVLPVLRTIIKQTAHNISIETHLSQFGSTCQSPPFYTNM